MPSGRAMSLHLGDVGQQGACAHAAALDSAAPDSSSWPPGSTVIARRRAASAIMWPSSRCGEKPRCLERARQRLDPAAVVGHGRPSARTPIFSCSMPTRNAARLGAAAEVAPRVVDRRDPGAARTPPLLLIRRPSGGLDERGPPSAAKASGLPILVNVAWASTLRPAIF